MSLASALQSKDVVQVLAQAWTKTTNTGNEYGGWICQGKDKRFTATITTDNGRDGIILTRPKDLDRLKQKGFTILAQFHCHPAKTLGACRPSTADIEQARTLKYASIVFTYDPDHVFDKLKCSQAPAPFDQKGVVMWYAGDC